jgi:hypothetical protein
MESFVIPSPPHIGLKLSKETIQQGNFLNFGTVFSIQIGTEICPTSKQMWQCLAIASKIQKAAIICQSELERKKVAALDASGLKEDETPSTAAEVGLQSPVSDSIPEILLKPKKIVKKIDSNNTRFMTLLARRKSRTPNFVELNAKRNFVYQPTYKASREMTVFNYSGQKLGSVEQQIFAKGKDKEIFGYGKDYLSSIPNQ